MCIKEEKNSQSSLSPSFPVNGLKHNAEQGEAQLREGQGFRKPAGEG